MRWYSLAVGILGVWRITHLLHAEDGPGQAVVRLRRLAGTGFWGEVMDCFYCLSVWVAMPVALVTSRSWRERLLLTAALSGGAILAERVTAPESAPSVAEYEEDEEEDDGVLWRSAKTGLRG